MTRDDVVRKANQIADFFRPYDDEEATSGVAGHIRQFWDPRMRADLARYLSEDDSGFTEIALKGAQIVVQEDHAKAAGRQA